MSRRKMDIRDEILNQNEVIITKESDEYFFEIDREITSDVAEAVSILMSKVEWNDPIWKTKIDIDIIYENITPCKSLFWLSGGYSEWRTMKHYNTPWCNCYLDFQEEFGFLVVGIVRKSKTLSDIRDGFVKYLNLPVIYNFAISRDMIKVN